MGGRGWEWEFFVEKGWIIGAVMRSMLERGREEARLLAGLLEAHGVPRGSRVLELGCGIGRVAVPLASEGFRVTCLDLSPEYTREAQGYAERVGVSEAFSVVAGDAWRVDELVEGPFDAVLLFWTTLLGYRGRREADVELLSRARRVAREGGLLLVLRQAHRDLVVYSGEKCRGPRVSRLGEGLVLVEEPVFDAVSSTLENTWRLYREEQGSLRLLGEAGFRIRVYTVTEIVEIAGEAGWRLEAVYGGLDRRPFRPLETGVNAVFRAV